MRRKLVLITVALIAAVFCFVNMGIDLIPQGTDELLDSDIISGRIIRIQIKEDYANLIIKEIHTGIKILLKTYDFNNNILNYAGSFVSVHTELDFPIGCRNPHCFDYSKYLYSKNIFLTGESTGDIEFLRNDFLSHVMHWISNTKFTFRETLDDNCRGLVMGILFGETEDIDQETFDNFRNAGTAHILAVSGLHVNLLYDLFKKIFGKRRSSVKFVLLIIFLIVYGSFASWSPSVIRAEGMIVLKIIGEYKDLRYDSLSALSFVALILLIHNPYIVFSQGFQMSFLAIASLNVFTKVMPRIIGDNLNSTLAVSVTLTAYQGFCFNRISFVSVVANIPVLFLSGILIPFAFLTFIFFLISGDIGLLGIPLGILVNITETVNNIVSLDGNGSMDVISINSGFIILLLGLLFFEASEFKTILKLRFKYREIAVSRLLIVVISLISGIMYYNPVSASQIVFVDVGQGDCIHLRDHNVNVLIDGGGSFKRNTGKKTLKPYLLKNRVSNIDLILATHEDMDHYKGLTELTECFKTPEIILGSTLGDRFIASDKMKITTLWPLVIDSESQNSNSQCSVYLIEMGEIRIITTGDLDVTGEREMLEYYNSINKSYMLKAHILKVGHHGSYTSTSDEFINAVNPDIAVIQVGKNNYGHPSSEVIKKLQNAGIKVYRNDTMGAVGIRLNHKMSEIKRISTMLEG